MCPDNTPGPPVPRLDWFTRVGSGDADAIFAPVGATSKRMRPRGWWHVRGARRGTDGRRVGGRWGQCRKVCVASPGASVASLAISTTWPDSSVASSLWPVRDLLVCMRVCVCVRACVLRECGSECRQGLLVCVRLAAAWWACFLPSWLRGLCEPLWLIHWKCCIGRNGKWRNHEMHQQIDPFYFPWFRATLSIPEPRA